MNPEKKAAKSGRSEGEAMGQDSLILEDDWTEASQLEKGVRDRTSGATDLDNDQPMII